MTLSETKSKSENEETIHINTIFLQKRKIGERGHPGYGYLFLGKSLGF